LTGLLGEGIAVDVRSRIARRACLLISFWVAVQMAPPIFVIGISSGDHTPSLGGFDSLVLRHDHHAEHSDHRHSPVEEILVTSFAENGSHGDHLVRLPDSEVASRPEMPDGLTILLAGYSPAGLALGLPARVFPTGRSRAVGLPPPDRNRPLLL